MRRPSSRFRLSKQPVQNAGGTWRWRGRGDFDLIDFDRVGAAPPQWWDAEGPRVRGRLGVGSRYVGAGAVNVWQDRIFDCGWFAPGSVASPR